MNWSLASLRIQLALAKFRRYSNNGMDDRANWDRRVGDLQEIIDSSCPSIPAEALPRTGNGSDRGVFIPCNVNQDEAHPITDMTS